MPFIDQIAHGAALLARQATSAAATAATTVAVSVVSAASVTGTADSATATDAATAMPSSPYTGTAVSVVPSGTDSASNATSTGSSSNSSSGNGSSPLLFFVALGFGVVFTNLWIIVGVKYCFRYNARARQMRMAAEDGEPINLEAMPRPHRRRREKKLMTIDEVNEKFPMLKYKNWVASRERDGLSTEGGINAPSRSGSVRSVEGVSAVIRNLQPKERDSTDEPDEKRKHDALAETATASVPDSRDGATVPADSETITASSASQEAILQKATSSEAAKAPLTQTEVDAAVASAQGVYGRDGQDSRDGSHPRASDEHSHDDDDDEHIIDAALPPEFLSTTGDTCAICIDTLEDDDDVRGLTCGHAFHAVCIDPWLTSRRACCPLCKADYYTPKPRAPPPETTDASVTPAIVIALTGAEARRTHLRSNNTWMNFRAPTNILSSRFGNGSQTNQAPAGPGQPTTAETAAAGGAADAGLPAPPAPAQTADSSSSTRRALFPRRWQPAAAESLQTGEATPAPSSNSNWLARSPMAGLRNALRRGPGSQAQGQAAGTAGAPVTPSQLEAGVQHEHRP